jgi:hypothetical protein
MSSNRLRINEAKAKLTIPVLWQMFTLAGKPAKSCRSPFREDRHPSFSVSDDGRYFHDFATGEKGDAIDFLAKTRAIPVTQAFTEFLNLANANSYPITNARAGEETKTINTCDPYQLAQAGISFANKASQRLASDSKLLAGLVARRPEWSIDALRGIALDGDLGFSSGELVFHYSHGIKARGKSPDGSRYFRWIVGSARGDCWRQSLLIPSHQTVYITEGESDAITMISRGYDIPGEQLVVALPGGFSRLNPGPFKGRKIVIIADTDDAGINCADRLKLLLNPVAQKVLVVRL